MSKLFETGEINGMQLANRFVRSATWEGMAGDDGGVTPQLIKLMTDLAKGGVGLIISSHAYVRQEGQAGARQLGVYKDELIPGLKEMTRAVHDNGSKTVMQLAHAGNFASAKLTGKTPWVPSAIEGLSKGPRKEMTSVEIQELIESFVEAAERAKTAGFDGIQIHSAHGYLLSQFLSPIFNHREDDYGGNIRNRARIHLEILEAVRRAVGHDYPILVKMNCQDFADHGLSLADSLETAILLEKGGIDAIELSGGLLINPKLNPSRMGIKTEDKEAYFKEESKAYKQKVSVPIILVGGNRSFSVAEDLIEQGVADYISMSRPFIREPDLVNRWKSGDLRKANCKSDNMCFEPAMKGKGIYCLTEERERQKKEI